MGRGGLRGSAPRVSRWLGDIREFFPSSVVQVIQRALPLGPTGQRVFLLQGRQGSLTVTVKLEKQQVAALSQYLAKVLEELPDLHVVLMTGSDDTGEVPWPVLTKPFELERALSLVAGRRP